MTTVLEDLPLIRAKAHGIYNETGTGPNVGPGSYKIDYDHEILHSQAPFNSSSQRKPLSEVDTVVPGPGAYVINEPEKGLGIASCPFISEATRFAGAAEEAPGPGAYHTADKWPTKKNPRSHKFTLVHDRYPHVAEPPIDGGFYQPDFSALNRAKPRAAHFGQYSEREPPKFNSNPGPGTYNPDAKVLNMYTSKPSSMFATNTSRSGAPNSDTPGPGSYNLPYTFTRKPRTETFSAFGSAQSRFFNRDPGNPGPGSYTGEIAPRRHKPIGSLTAAFASNNDRFPDDGRPTPGPGAYCDKKLPKHITHGGEAPFGSTVPRFSTRMVDHPGEYFASTGPLRIPQRIPGHPIKVTRPVTATDTDSGMRFQEENSSYVPKPTSTTVRSTFGSARQSEPISKVPGPGSYNGGVSNIGRDNGMPSGWGKEVRFPGSGCGFVNPGPGEYHHNSTLLKKTYNCTIQSDTTALTHSVKRRVGGNKTMKKQRCSHSAMAPSTINSHFFGFRGHDSTVDSDTGSSIHDVYVNQQTNGITSVVVYWRRGNPAYLNWFLCEVLMLFCLCTTTYYRNFSHPILFFDTSTSVYFLISFSHRCSDNHTTKKTSS
eukprot:gene6082-4377_t